MATWKERFIAKQGVEAYERRKAEIRAYMHKRYHEDSAFREKVIVESVERNRSLDPAVRRARVAASKAKNPEAVRDWNREYASERRAAETADERRERYDRENERRRALLNQRKSDGTFAEFRAKATARHLAWREANREHVNARSREWAKAHPEYRRAIQAVQNHRRRAAGKFDKEFVAWLYTQACIDCGSRERIEVGHIVSVKDGGTNDPANLIPQCRPCNRRLSGKSHRGVRRR
jgi:hypothetical protein